MPGPLDWITSELSSLHEQGLLRPRRSAVPLPDGWCELDGKRLRNFASNDYLNLAHDPRLISAACEALAQGGAGATASPLITGRTVWHAELEAQLAEFTGQPAALLFPTGYAANLGTIPALAGEQDVIFCDRLNHGSLVDGCRLSKARIRLYRHEDLDRLERELSNARSARRRLIVTDSLFSMDGDFAPLAQLCDLAERYAAGIMIDEAHAVGVAGEHGRGAAEHLQVEGRIPIRVGTLSKALGSLGGFVSGPRELIDWLWNQARPHMFSTALPPSACAAAAVAVDIVRREPWRREQLLRLAEELRAGLQELLGIVGAAALPTGTALDSTAPPPASTGPIVVVIVKSPEGAVEAAARLADRGYLVAAIRPPTVPRGTSRLRISLTSAHTSEDVVGLLRALGETLRSMQPRDADSRQ